MFKDASHLVWVKLKSAYFRITFSRYSAAFFLFGFLHCLAVGMIQSFMFTTDINTGSLINGVVQEANVPSMEIPWLTRPNGEFNLQLCQDIPYGHAPYPYCTTIFQSGAGNMSVPSGYRRSEDAASLPPSPQLTATEAISSSVQKSSSGEIEGVNLQINGGNITLGLTCTRVLTYPRQVLEFARREDITFICIQIWLFWLSFVAVVYDSVPHTLAVIAARTITTGWSAYTIWRLENIELRFETLVSGPQSPCHVDLFPGYFPSKQGLQIGDLVLNCTALTLSIVLGWQLVKSYSANTFMAVGPPPKIKRIYGYFLSVYVCLQLSALCLITAMALWVDQLHNSPIAVISAHTAVYMAGFTFTTACLGPWLVMGWISIRREMKWVMLVFLTIGCVFIVVWSLMFYSQVYRWIFVQWPFFGCLTVAAFIALTSTLVLGGVCWRNFNQGLAEFLRVEKVLERQDFEPDVFSRDVEKARGSFESQSVKDMTEEEFIATLHKNDPRQSV